MTAISQSWKLWLLSVTSVCIMVLLVGSTKNLVYAQFEAPSQIIPGDCFMNGAVVCLFHTPTKDVIVLHQPGADNATLLKVPKIAAGH